MNGITLLNAIKPELIANKIVSVQPVKAPNSIDFKLFFEYESPFPEFNMMVETINTGE